VEKDLQSTHASFVEGGYVTKISTTVSAYVNHAKLDAVDNVLFIRITLSMVGYKPTVMHIDIGNVVDAVVEKRV
jgi:hypothetical protein